MKKILMIEDDHYKIRQVRDVLCNMNVELIVKHSYNSGLRAILLSDETFDGLILDMGFPTFDDSYDINPEQGLYVLSELDRKGVNLPTIIYSGNEYDVSSYEFIKDYILSNGTCISKRILKFVEFIN